MSLGADLPAQRVLETQAALEKQNLRTLDFCPNSQYHTVSVRSARLL